MSRYSDRRGYTGIDPGTESVERAYDDAMTTRVGEEVTLVCYVDDHLDGRIHRRESRSQ